VTKIDWDKAKRGKSESEPKSVRQPSERELGFLRAHQASMKRQAAARLAAGTTPTWLLLNRNKSVIASTRAENADAARKLFKASGRTGRWLRRVG
jgi:hypothetical protein